MVYLTFYSSKPIDSLFNYINKRLNTDLHSMSYGELIDWFAKKGIDILIINFSTSIKSKYECRVVNFNTIDSMVDYETCWPSKYYSTWTACANAAIKHAAKIYAELNKQSN